MTRQRKCCTKNHAFSVGPYEVENERLLGRCLVRCEFYSQMDRVGNVAYLIMVQSKDMKATLHKVVSGRIYEYQRPRQEHAKLDA